MLQEYNSNHRVWFAEDDSPLWQPVSQHANWNDKKVTNSHAEGKTGRFSFLREGVSHQLFAFAMERWSQKVLPKKELLQPHTSIHRSLDVSMPPQATYFHFCITWMISTETWHSCKHRGTDFFRSHDFFTCFFVAVVCLEKKNFY